MYSFVSDLFAQRYVLRLIHVECRCRLFILIIIQYLHCVNIPDGHWGNFQFGAIMKRAGMNISFGIYLGMELMGQSL